MRKQTDRQTDAASVVRFYMRADIEITLPGVTHAFILDDTQGLHLFQQHSTTKG